MRASARVRVIGQLRRHRSGHALSKQELELVMSKLDTSGDGKVAFDEFLLWWDVGLSLEALLNEDTFKRMREKVKEGEASVLKMAEQNERESTAVRKQRAAADTERNECREAYGRPRRGTIAASLKDRPARERGGGLTPRMHEPAPLPGVGASNGTVLDC